MPTDATNATDSTDTPEGRRLDCLYRVDPLLGRAAAMRGVIRRAAAGDVECAQFILDRLDHVDRLLTDVMGRLVSAG